jgi:hypothetical protein
LHALPGASVTITTTLTNIGRGVATSEAGTPIQVCLYRGTSPSGNLVSCQDLLEGDQLNYNDTRQFAFSILANNGQQPVYATVSSHGYNGSTTNDVATGALGDIPAPQLTGVFVDGVLPQALDIQWMPPSVPGLGGYRILRSSTPGGPYELVGETTGTFLPDLLLTRGQEYCYVVQAYDSGGTVSPYSNEACGMVPLLSMYMPLVRREGVTPLSSPHRRLTWIVIRASLGRRGG